MKIFTKFRPSLMFMTSLFILLTAIGSSNNFCQENSTNQYEKDGEKTYIFKDKGSSWRVEFKGDSIYAIYKNGELTPQEEKSLYEDMIYDNLADLQLQLSGKKFKFYGFNLPQLRHGIKRFWHDFDEEEFNDQMEKLDEELDKLKDMDFEFYFDQEKLKENMNELKENLKDLDVDIDMDEFHKQMEKLREEMRNKKFDFDSIRTDRKELRDKIRSLREELRETHFENLKGKEEASKTKEFVKQLKEELVNDGYLESTDSDLNLKMNSEGIKVNGVMLPNEKFEKYKDIYKENFGKEFQSELNININ